MIYTALALIPHHWHPSHRVNALIVPHRGSIPVHAVAVMSDCMNGLLRETPPSISIEIEKKNRSCVKSGPKHAAIQRSVMLSRWRIFGKEPRDGKYSLLTSGGFTSSRWGIRGVERWVGVHMRCVPFRERVLFALVLRRVMVIIYIDRQVSLWVR